MPLDKATQEFFERMFGDRLDLLENGLRDRFAHTDRKIDKINEILTGNGDPSKGLIVRLDRMEQSNEDQKDLPVRVDRLEQREERQDFINKTVMTAAIGSVVTFVGGVIVWVVKSMG